MSPAHSVSTLGHSGGVAGSEVAAPDDWAAVGAGPAAPCSRVNSHCWLDYMWVCMVAGSGCSGVGDPVHGSVVVQARRCEPECQCSGQDCDGMAPSS